MILEPSWELADQTHKAMVSFAKYLPSPALEMALLIGGQSIQAQAQVRRIGYLVITDKALSQGVDIVTGTPGRIEGT